MVFKDIGPSVLVSESDEIPETSEKKTNGTTKSFNRFRKMSPPKLKMYCATKFFNSSGIKVE